MMQFISGPALPVYLQSVQAYISPPIAAVFLIGVLWKRVNARGAIASLLAGFVLGMGRLVAEINAASLDGWMLRVVEINFLHFAVLLFAICSAVLVLVSLATPEPSRARLAGLTFATAGESNEQTSDLERSSPAWRRRDVWLTVLVALCVALVWIYFTG